MYIVDLLIYYKLQSTYNRYIKFNTIFNGKGI